jgi:malyl-CoA/(S)-citramalyl-CoA lyase
MNKLRRSLLMTPGHDRRLAEKAAASEADMVWLELEDGVAMSEKAAARAQIVRSFGELDWQHKVKAVRVNAVDSGMAEEDIRAVISARPDAIVLSKTQGPDDVATVARLLDSLGSDAAEVRIWAMVETVIAVVRIEQIAVADARVAALIFGAGGLFGELGVSHVPPGNVWSGATFGSGTALESTLYARSRVVFAARAFGLLPIDGSTGSGDGHQERRDDMYLSALYSFRMGFEGKLCARPQAVPAVHRAWAPPDEDIAWARKVRAAFATPGGFKTIDGQMTLGGPAIERAALILARAQALGLEPEESR